MDKLTTFFKDVDTKIKSKLSSSFGSGDEVSPISLVLALVVFHVWAAGQLGVIRWVWLV